MGRSTKYKNSSASNTYTASARYESDATFLLCWALLHSISLNHLHFFVSNNLLSFFLPPSPLFSVFKKVFVFSNLWTALSFLSYTISSILCPPAFLILYFLGYICIIPLTLPPYISSLFHLLFSAVSVNLLFIFLISISRFLYLNC